MTVAAAATTLTRRERELVDFWVQARTIAFLAADHGTHRLYERLEALYVARFPDHDHRQYEATVRELARMAGV